MTAVSRYVWFYRYAPKPLEATALASTQKLLLQNWRPAGVLGRLFLAPEGVNAQLAVPQGYLPALTEQLQRCRREASVLSSGTDSPVREREGGQPAWVPGR